MIYFLYFRCCIAQEGGKMKLNVIFLEFTKTTQIGFGDGNTKKRGKCNHNNDFFEMKPSSCETWSVFKTTSGEILRHFSPNAPPPPLSMQFSYFFDSTLTRKTKFSQFSWKKSLQLFHKVKQIFISCFRIKREVSKAYNNFYFYRI